MSSLNDAKRAVVDFFNSHARGRGEAGQPVRFLSDVNGTLDNRKVGRYLDQFLVDVLNMGERLQDVVISVKLMTGDPGQSLPFKIVEELNPVATGWLLTKPFAGLAPLKNADMVFDDDDAIRLLAGFANATGAVLDPASKECESLLSAWCELGQLDAGKAIQDQVFQAWYNGQQLENS